MQDIKAVLTSEQASQILNVTPARVRQLVYEGKLEGIQRAGTWFFAPEAIEAARNRPKSKGGRGKKGSPS